MSAGKVKKNRKNRKNSEKYFQKFGKILVRPKKKGPHSNLGKKFGKILKIRKNTSKNSEKILGKYSRKFGKIFWKIWKNTPQNQDPIVKITFFQL